MAVRDDLEGIRTLVLPGRKPWGPDYPTRMVAPDIVKTSCNWGHYAPKNVSLGTVGATTVRNSGFILRINDCIDPDWNAGQSAPSIVDEYAFIAMGMRYYFVSGATVIVQTWGTAPSTTNQEVLNHRLVAFVGGKEQVIPGPSTPWSEAQYALMKMKSTPIKNIYADSARTTLMFRWTPNYQWPARNAYEDPNNWGTMPSLTGEAVKPVNPAFLWYGVMQEQPITTSNTMTFRLRVHVKFDVTFVRDPLIRLVPGGLSTDWVPYSEWSTKEGYAENPDETGEPDTWEDFDATYQTGTAADLGDATSNTHWYDNP